MHNTKQELRNLQERARGGDQAALAELSDRIAVHLPAIVRRAMRQTESRSAFTRAIQDVTQGAAEDRFSPEVAQRPGLVSRVTRALCSLCSSGLGGRSPSPAWLNETVRI
jgi:hypothetical protein